METPHVLVTYAPRGYSTVAIAEMIDRTLCQRGALVDRIPVTDLPSPRGYDAVVIGSALRDGAWLADASTYIANYQHLLAQIPTAFFTISANLNTSADEDRVAACLQPIRAKVTPVIEGYFADTVSYKQLSYLTWYLLHTRGGRAEQSTNWSEVRDWAADLIPAFATTE